MKNTHKKQGVERLYYELTQITADKRRLTQINAEKIVNNRGFH